jgi:hypothetical protein
MLIKAYASYVMIKTSIVLFRLGTALTEPKTARAKPKKEFYRTAAYYK